MKKYTANYSFTNHNFVFQNIRENRTKNNILPAICILKNILQRGKPTLMSSFLQEKLGKIHKQESFANPYPLISNDKPDWQRIIRGNDKGNYFPAKKFFEELIPKYLSEYQFIQQLIVPEVLINEITQVKVDDFKNQQVDFYLPQAFLVIEIDGSQHEKDQEKDILRDAHLKNYSIQTIRIATKDLEAENNTFLKSIQKIKHRIEQAILQQRNITKKEKTFISIQNYLSAYQKTIDLSESYYISTGIIRFQLLILELLEHEYLNFDNNWSIELLERDVNDFAEIAIQDLFLWLRNLFQLLKIPFQEPDVKILKKTKLSDFSADPQSIKIDFSILKRYTDENQVNPDIIFARTDYFDEYMFFKKTHANKIEFSSLKPYDYFQISTTNPVSYKLMFGGDRSDETSLLFLLWNIFLQNSDHLRFEELKFREGQLPIIANILARNETIGLLPTGSGKSVCYQLSAILQPGISFVVCPIKSLMYDQKADLDSVYFTRTNHITSDDDAEEKDEIHKAFAEGHYFFIFISPERFQIKSFRQYLELVDNNFSIAYAVIDEAHCLSEWGHDFRTSYLNLANTIKRYCRNFRFLALTATASIQVLKDMQLEFGVKQENIKTPLNYSREELEFIVVAVKSNNKENVIVKHLTDLRDNHGALLSNGKASKCGLIFTPTVNGKNGCYSLAKTLGKAFNHDVKYFAGGMPNEIKGTEKEEGYDDFKKEVQNGFKNNEFTLLTATKAFGMGVNKGNIHYTFHYGIPGSMESLYQEAGRAGRDKSRFIHEKAKCYVLLEKNKDSDVLEKIFEKQTSLEKIKELRSDLTGDLSSNIFLFGSGLDFLDIEHEIIKKIHQTFSKPNSVIQVKGDSILIKDGSGEKSAISKFRAEKAIYRLSQLGIVKDWTISNFYGGGEFEVEYTDYSQETIKEYLLQTIQKYEKDFSFEAIEKNADYQVYREIINNSKYTGLDSYIRILLQWSYDHFAYNRRQSLKTIYEACCSLADNKVSKEGFKAKIEDYFKFSESTYILQHIAENPNDIEKWHEVFRDEDKTVLGKRGLESLRDNLSRFLESYMNNVGLDFVSGLVRLLLDDYENLDGRKRLEYALNQIQKYKFENREIILENTLALTKSLSFRNRNELGQVLCTYFEEESFLLKIADCLNDTTSTEIILKKSVQRLSQVKERIYGTFSKTS